MSGRRRAGIKFPSALLWRMIRSLPLPVYGIGGKTPRSSGSKRVRSSRPRRMRCSPKFITGCQSSWNQKTTMSGSIRGLAESRAFLIGSSHTGPTPCVDTASALGSTRCRMTIQPAPKNTVHKCCSENESVEVVGANIDRTDFQGTDDIGLDRDHIFLVLEFALNDQEFAVGYEASILLVNTRCNYRIGNSCLIFKAQEY